MLTKSDRARLGKVRGLIEPEEGEKLAEMAAAVPADQAIVEIGSYRGLSTCHIGAGSRGGNGAHVFAVDPWPAYAAPGMDPDEWGEEEVWSEHAALERFRANIAALMLEPFVTPLRSTALVIAAVWTQPVGLFFHDADHAYEAVRDDYLAWLPFLAPGCWVAVHDFYGSTRIDNAWVRDGSMQTAVADHILTSGEFTDVEIVGNLWIGRRA